MEEKTVAHKYKPNKHYFTQEFNDLMASRFTLNLKY